MLRPCNRSQLPASEVPSCFGSKQPPLITHRRTYNVVPSHSLRSTITAHLWLTVLQTVKPQYELLIIEVVEWSVELNSNLKLPELDPFLTVFSPRLFLA